MKLKLTMEITGITMDEARKIMEEFEDKATVYGADYREFLREE